MQVKTFTAPDMPAALKLIKNELGPGAIVLHTKKIEGANGKPTLEITAAVDPAHHTATAAEQLNAQPALGNNSDNLLDTLGQHGLADAVIEKIEKAATALADTGFSTQDTLQMVIGKIVNLEPPAQAFAPGVHIVIGPTGAGKTTLIARLAVMLRRQGKSVGLISLDNTKLGGFEPLAILSDVMTDQAELVGDETEFAAAIEKLDDRDYLLIDTPGLSPYDTAGIQALSRQLQAVSNATVHLVTPITYHAQDLAMLPAAFAPLSPQHLIITKLDETRRWGGLVNIATQSGLKLCFATNDASPSASPLELDADTIANHLKQTPTYPWETR